MAISKPHEVDKAAARKSLKVALYKKIDAAKENHRMVLKDARISTNFASITASVVREKLSKSALDTVFSSLVRDIAVANRVNVLTHSMATVKIRYVDHISGEVIAVDLKSL